MSLKKDLIRHEGHRNHLYEDTEGVMSIGVGYNIDERGLPDHIIDMLLDETIEESREELDRVFPAWVLLSPNRQDVLVNMIFNMGGPSFLGFRRMIAALKAFDYDTAAHEMLESRWADQVGARALELSERMRNDS